MESEKIEFAVLVPKSINELDLSKFSNNKVSVTGNILDTKPTEQALDFDLVNAGELAWYSIKIIGTGAVTIALGMIANHLSSKVKEYANEKETFKIIVRFPSGRRVRVSSKDKKLLEELKAELE